MKWLFRVGTFALIGSVVFTGVGYLAGGTMKTVGVVGAIVGLAVGFAIAGIVAYLQRGAGHR
jgi:hypothetical protein